MVQETTFDAAPTNGQGPAPDDHVQFACVVVTALCMGRPVPAPALMHAAAATPANDNMILHTRDQVESTGGLTGSRGNHTACHPSKAARARRSCKGHPAARPEGAVLRHACLDNEMPDLRGWGTRDPRTSRSRRSSLSPHGGRWHPLHTRPWRCPLQCWGQPAGCGTMAEGALARNGTTRCSVWSSGCAQFEIYNPQLLLRGQATAGAECEAIGADTLPVRSWERPQSQRDVVP